jgi:putative Mn2+ efflux pump MntP
MLGMLRLGIILTVTGVLALAHYFFGNRGVLPRRAELITAIVLIVLGVPLLVVAATRG